MKKARPTFMRRRIACPECGFIYKDEGHLRDHTTHRPRKIAGLSDPVPIAVICPQCANNMTYGEFWDSHYDKWGYTSVADMDT